MLPRDGKWSVLLHDRHHGPYETRDAALRDAVEVAHSSGLMGVQSQVLVQAADGSFHPHWTFGTDPLP